MLITVVALLSGNECSTTITVLCVNYSNTAPEKDSYAQQENNSSNVTKKRLGKRETIREGQLDKWTGNDKIEQQNVDTKEKPNIKANRRDSRLFWPKKLSNRIAELDRYDSTELLFAVKERLDKRQTLQQRKPKLITLNRPPIPGKPKYLVLAVANRGEDNEEQLEDRFLNARPGLFLYDSIELLSAIKERLSKVQTLTGHRWYRYPKRGRPFVGNPRQPQPRFFYEYSYEY